MHLTDKYSISKQEDGVIFIRDRETDKFVLVTDAAFNVAIRRLLEGTL